jgi:CMP-N,N'-diacetyllegionaminic acid synthase
MDKPNQPDIIALIPARSGSKRLPDKNIRLLAGCPLIAYTIAAALQSNIFAKVIVSTDSEHYADIARQYGAEVPCIRPSELSGDLSPDIEWIEYTLNRARDDGTIYDCFSILRPTSPFRQPETIQRAWRSFLNEKGIDSLRAVQKCKEHPGKMWVIRGRRMMPLMPLTPQDRPWHSSQYQSLPEVYVQNASLEIAWTRVVFEEKTIAGSTVMPFITDGYEGFDLNTPYDWMFAEDLIKTGKAKLPRVESSLNLL